MRHQGGAGTGGFTPERTELAGLRLQLEGGLEVLEACSMRYRELSAALEGRGWKARLREGPGLLRNARDAEASVHEVLERLQRRAQQEPDAQGPASTVLREVEAARTELSRHIARRLPVPAEASLAERLGRLEAVPLKPLPLPPGQGELVLLEGSARWPPLRHFVFFFLSWYLAAPFVGGWVAVPLFLLFYVWFYLRSGHYWLTSERLVWKPRLGEPVQVVLSSLGDGDVTLGFGSTVRVRGRVGMTLRHVPRAWRLAALLCIHRRREFRDVARREPSHPLVLLDMYRTRPGETPDTESAVGGMGVLRPGYVLYVPHSAQRKFLDAITEPVGSARGPEWLARDKVEVPLSLLLEQLQLLPEDRMEALLEKAPHALPELVRWKSGELKWNFGSSLALEVVRGEEALWASVPSWAAHQHVGWIIQAWHVR